MDGSNHPRERRLRDARERTVARLTESFANDEISLENFEERIKVAYRAGADSELEGLVADLEENEPVPRSRHVVVVEGDPLPGSSRAELAPVNSAGVTTTTPLARALFGSTERTGAFTLPQRGSAVATFGSVVVDTRDARIPEGVTELHVRAVCGSVEIVVPADVTVECEGTGILGSFEGTSHAAFASDGARVLRVIGTAVLGSIEVRTRPPADVERRVLALREALRKERSVGTASPAALPSPSGEAKGNER